MTNTISSAKATRRSGSRLVAPQQLVDLVTEQVCDGLSRVFDEFGLSITDDSSAIESIVASSLRESYARRRFCDGIDFVVVMEEPTLPLHLVLVQCEDIGPLPGYRQTLAVGTDAESVWFDRETAQMVIDAYASTTSPGFDRESEYDYESDAFLYRDDQDNPGHDPLVIVHGVEAVTDDGTTVYVYQVLHEAPWTEPVDDDAEARRLFHSQLDVALSALSEARVLLTALCDADELSTASDVGAEPSSPDAALLRELITSSAQIGRASKQVA